MRKQGARWGDVKEASARLAGPAGWWSGSRSSHTIGGEEDAAALELQILRWEDRRWGSEAVFETRGHRSTNTTS